MHKYKIHVTFKKNRYEEGEKRREGVRNETVHYKRREEDGGEG